MPTIRLNGDDRDVAPDTTIADLVEGLGLGDRPVAVERNRAIVPRERFDSTVIAEGDTIEVVSFVPGG